MKAFKDEMKQAEKYVLVTGAYGGMGRAVTNALKEQGFCVFALDKRVEKREEGIISIEADIQTPSGVEAALAEVKAHTDTLFAIVHFAGIYMLDSLVEIDADAFRRILDVNFYGAFLVNKTFFPLLREGSRILITTSELAPLDPLPFTGLYAVTKSALDKYAYSLRMELQLLGVSVSVLRAGAIKTDMLGVSTDALDRFCKKTTLYRCNAKRFRSIVNRVEARCVPPKKIARKAVKILAKRKPKFAYSINRNPLLLLLSALPKRLQLFAIRMVLR